LWEGELLYEAVDPAVILSEIDLGAEAAHELPIVEETVGKYRVLLDSRCGNDLSFRGFGLFDDCHGLVIFCALNLLRE
jgi:hypothetical protein